MEAMTPKMNLVARCNRLKSECIRVRENRKRLLSRYFRCIDPKTKMELEEQIEFANLDLRVIELKMQKLGV